MGYDLHIVRTREWSDASKKPITKSDVDTLIKGDAELAWSTSDYLDMRDPRTQRITRYYVIQWKKQSAFWWYRYEITCKNPNEAQQGKLIQMARTLKAMVVGDEGERYELRKSFLSADKIVTIPWPN